jgi:hypothetical protein
MMNRKPDGPRFAHGFDTRGPDALEHFQSMVGQSLKTPAIHEYPEYFTATRMREDKTKANWAHSLRAELGVVAKKFLRRGVHIDDVYEILASVISDKAFRQIAKDKYGLIDPLD